MAYNELLNQTISLYTKTSLDAYGRKQVGSAVSHVARVQETTKAILLPNGETVNIVAIVYLKPDVSVSNGDKIGYGGNFYKIFSKDTVIGQSVSHHIKLHLTKWQE